MRVTTLGTGTIALSAARACAGHFVEAGDVRLLLDCGGGVTRRLAELAIDWRTITHVALTHFHIDHHADLPTLVFAWKYGMLPARALPIEIIGPVGTTALVERLAAAYGEWMSAPGFPVTVRELPDAGPLALSPDVRLDWIPVPHTAESVAYSIERGTRRVVYTGDTGASDALAAWARGCDLLLCECSLPSAMSIPEHLTPERCATLAASARPRHLALTHFYPPVEPLDIQVIVGAQYDGPVTLAYDGWHFEIEDE